jgi:hypothetical protein
MQSAQVDQDVDKGVLIGDGLAVAKSGTFDAEFLGLTVDALGGSTLIVDAFVDVGVAIDLIADASTDAGGEGGDAALGPLLVTDGTNLAGGFWEGQGADVAAALVFDAGGFAGEGEFEGHGGPGVAQGQPLIIKLAVFPAPFGEGNSCKGLIEWQIVAVEVFVLDVRSNLDIKSKNWYPHPYGQRDRSW